MGFGHFIGLLLPLLRILCFFIKNQPIQGLLCFAKKIQIGLLFSKFISKKNPKLLFKKAISMFGCLAV